MTDAADVVAAGAVVTRPGPQVLLVHRPRHQDWSLPKGKLDPGERPEDAAVREVWEETGVAVQLGSRLLDQRYDVEAGRKVVHYWTARPVDGTGAGVTSYQPNEEIDEVAWVDLPVARRLLTYPRDRTTLDAAAALSEGDPHRSG